MTEKLEATIGIEPMHRGFADRTHARGGSSPVLRDDHILPDSTVRTTVTVGGLELCRGWDGPVLHACKVPCWLSVNRGPHASGEPATWRPDSLYLNLVDAWKPKYFNVPLFRTALTWLDLHAGRNVLIHCNKGLSRAPSIAMLWGARTGLYPAASYAEAVAAYPLPYQPGPGIAAFLEQHWGELWQR